MTKYEKDTGGRVLAIAHNGNLSNGIMFPEVESFSGKPVDKGYAATRAKWEPLYEVTQIKGDGEAHKFLSPNDEFASYEVWDKFNLNMSVPKKPEMLQYEYARSALQLGLKLEKKLGVNPYKFGMIGSTDSHTGLATAEEENFFGKHSGAEPNKDRASHAVAKFGDQSIMGWEQVASGYAGVWATDNTREALFDAMMRKETYAHHRTAHARAVLRQLRFRRRRCADPKPRRHGLCQGRADGRRPAQCAEGKVSGLPGRRAARSDRCQPRSHPDRQGMAGRQGRAPGEGVRRRVVGRSQAGSRRQAARGRQHRRRRERHLDQHDRIGRAARGVEGPEFSPKLKAFYYARVLEIPTPRWTAYDAKRFKIKMGPEVAMVTQERAYTSPIWYTP